MSTKVPDAAPGRSWRKIFSTKKGPEQKGCGSQSGGAEATTGLLTCAPPKRAALRAS